MEKKYQILRFLVYFLMLLPLILLRDVTPSNELRYLSIVDEALRDGHLFAFYNHGIAYADKPPLFFWLMMVGKALFGHHSMLYLSLLTIIPAFVTVNALDRLCIYAMPADKRIGAESALLSCLYFIASAIVIRMDMMMTMFITLALCTFYRMYAGEKKKSLKYLFPIYIFLAIFSKGAVGILVPLVCVPVFLLVRGRIKEYFRYWGWRTWLILALLCGLWFTAAYLEGGKEYLNNLLFHQTVDRAVNSFHHKEPFWFYMVHIWYIIFPWSFLAIGTIVIASIKKQERGELTRFFICTAVTIFVMMSLVSSKIDIYLLPCLGFIIYGTFMLLGHFKYHGFVRTALYIPEVLMALLLPAYLIAGLFVEIPYGDVLKWWMLLPSFILSFLALIATRQTHIESSVVFISSSIYLTLFLVGIGVKGLNPLIGYESLCNEAMAAAEERGIDKFVLALNEDGEALLKRGENIDVYLGKEAEMVPLAEIEAAPDSVLGPSAGMIVFKKKRFEVIMRSDIP